MGGFKLVVFYTVLLEQTINLINVVRYSGGHIIKNAGIFFIFTGNILDN